MLIEIHDIPGLMICHIRSINFNKNIHKLSNTEFLNNFFSIFTKN